MPSYPDRRQRYSNAAPWDFSPGTPNPNNGPAPEAKTTLAQRTEDSYEQDKEGKFQLTPGSHNPRRDFRKTTATVPPILPDDGTVFGPGGSINGPDHPNPPRIGSVLSSDAVEGSEGSSGSLAISDI